MLTMTAIAVIAFGGVLWAASDSLQRIALGPEPVTLTQLSSMGTEAVGNWFEVTAEVRPVQVLQTTSRSRKGGTTVTNHFALIKDKAVIVQTGWTALPATFPAWAGKFSEDNEFYNRVRRQLNLWGGARIPLSPLLLHPSNSVAFTRWITGSVNAAVTVALLFMLWRILRAMRDLTRTAPIARLRKSVRASEGLPTLIAEIDRQLAALDPKVRRSGPILLPSWLVRVRLNTFSLMSSSDVVWVAPYVFTSMLLGVIPGSKWHVVYVVSRTGKTLAIQVPEGRTQEVLGILHGWAPWAVVGPDPAMQAHFGKAGTRPWLSFHPSRAELLAAVDKRREQFLATRATQLAAGQTCAGPAAR